MRANDYLWVGLKLLGVYFLVSGFAMLSGTSFYMVSHWSQSNSGSSSWDPYNDLMWHNNLQGGASLLAGIILVCCARMLARRSPDDLPD